MTSKTRLWLIISFIIIVVVVTGVLIWYFATKSTTAIVNTSVDNTKRTISSLDLGQQNQLTYLNNYLGDVFNLTVRSKDSEEGTLALHPIYKVRGGNTIFVGFSYLLDSKLTTIAKKYGVTEQELTTLESTSQTDKILARERVLIDNILENIDVSLIKAQEVPLIQHVNTQSQILFPHNPPLDAEPYTDWEFVWENEDEQRSTREERQIINEFTAGLFKTSMFAE